MKTAVLRRHLLSVEAAMRACARRVGGNEDEWGLAGLFHDLDWESLADPSLHATMGADVLAQRGWPPEIVRAVRAHADHTNTPRQTPMEKSLFAVDELCGFIIACALVRPSKSLGELAPPSVRKKMRDKAFARAVNRDDIVKGAEQLGVDLDTHIAFVTEALKPVAAQIGVNP